MRSPVHAGRIGRRALLLAAAPIALAACQAPATVVLTTPEPPTPAASPAIAGQTSPPAATRPPEPTAVPASAPATPASTTTPVPPTPIVERQLRLTLLDKSWQVIARSIPSEIDTLLAPIAADVERPARSARLRIHDDGRVEFTAGQPGSALDGDASRDRVLRALHDGRAEAELAARPVDPAVTDAMLIPARDQLDRILTKAPDTVITIKGGERSWSLNRTEATELIALDLPKRPGDLMKVVLDEWPTRAFVDRLAKALDREPSNPRFAWNGGKLKQLRDGRSGRKLDQTVATGALARALLGAERTLELPLTIAHPVSADDPASLGIAELLEQGSTSLAGAIPEKKHNVKLAAERLNGVIVAPGATFSFNREVGPTTIETGFKWGFGITTGSEGIKTVPSVAGGICQVATTLFQPVFWAGYQLEERFWHLYWIPSYASRGVVGLDVTVDEEYRLDFKWINPTKHHVLIQALADDEKITFQLYGKKPDWTVKVDPAKVTNRAPPDTTPVIEEEPTLPWGRTIQVEAAREGFDVEVVRRVTPADGGEPRVLTMKSSYQPSRTVTLVGVAGKPADATAIDPARLALTPPAQNRPVGAGTPTADGTPAPGAPAPGTPGAVPGTPGPPTAPTTTSGGSGAAPGARPTQLPATTTPRPANAPIGPGAAPPPEKPGPTPSLAPPRPIPALPTPTPRR